MRYCLLILREISLHFFVKLTLNLRQILTNNINFLIIVLIVLVKLFTYVSSLFLELLKTLLSNICVSFLIISLFKIFYKVFIFVLF